MSETPSVLVLAAALLGCEAASQTSNSSVTIDSSIATEPPVSEALAMARAGVGLPTLASARAYAINIHAEHPSHVAVLVDDIGGLNPDRAPEQGVRLTDEQLLDIVRIAQSGDGDGVGPAYCFYPHHAIVFLDPEDRPLGELTICFMCGRVLSTVQGLGPDAAFERLARLFDEIGVPRELPVPGLPPAVGRPVVKQDIETAVRGCRARRSKHDVGDPGFGPLVIAVTLGESGRVLNLDGLEHSRVGDCISEWMGERSYPAAERTSVHRFEFPPAETALDE